MKRLGLAAVLAGACLGPACGCAINWQDVFLQSPGPPQTSPADLGLDFENVRIVSANGNTLAGWFVPAADRQPLATFLVHTGMQGNLDTYLPVVPWAARNGFNMLIYDWQGFGASQGVRDFANFEPDMHAAVDYLLSRPESASGIIQLGASLGSIPAMAATASYPDQTIGLILYGASFTDEMASTWLATQVSFILRAIGRVGDRAWALLLPEFFEARNYLDAIHVPILAVTPEDDTIVPPEAQDSLYAALPEPKQRYLTFGGHVHAPETDPQLAKVVVGWARNLVAHPQR